MRLLTNRKVVGLLLALFLASPSAFCWACCCATEAMPSGHAPAGEAPARTAGHACCAKPVKAPQGPAMSPAACDCQAFSTDPVQAATAVAPASPKESDRPAPTVAALTSPAADRAPRLSVCWDAEAAAAGVPSQLFPGPASPRAPPALLS